MSLISVSDPTNMIARLVRLAKVVETNDQGQVKVIADEITSPWLSCMTPRAAKTATWTPFEVDEQVLLLCPSGDLAQGIVIGALYQEAFPAPSAAVYKRVIQFEDESRLAYDQKKHQLQVNLATDEALLQVRSEANIDQVAKQNFTLTTEEGDITGTAKNMITLTADTSIALVVGENSLTLDANGIQIKAKQVQFDVTNTLGANAQDIQLGSKGATSIDAKGSLKLEAGSSVDIKGSSSVKVDGGGSVKVTGGMINLN